MGRSRTRPSRSRARDLFYSGQLPAADWSKVEQKSGRGANGGRAVEETSYIPGGQSREPDRSCRRNLSEQRTDNGGLPQSTKIFRKGRLSARVPADSGVRRELKMAAVMERDIGAAGGVIPCRRQFLLFQRISRNQDDRLAALQSAARDLIWTHDCVPRGRGNGPGRMSRSSRASCASSSVSRTSKAHRSLLGA